VNYTAGANGSITGNTAQTINHGANATSVTAVPATGYNFVSWSDGILTAVRTDTNIQANLNVTATFAINQYAVNYSAGANGSITGNTAQTINHGANATSVTAVPATGYHFVSWSDGALTAVRTDTNLQGNLSVTATFAINQYAVNYSAGANGSITGNTAQTINHGANATSVTAVPATGYHFVSWSDGILTAVRTDTNIQANLSVTATFAMEPYSSWMASFPSITAPADQVPGADPDQDGLANSVEFVVGTNPSLPNGSVLHATHHGTHISFQFDRVKAAGTAGFSSVVELDDQNLGNWSAALPEMVQIVDHGTTETVTVTVPAASPQGKFARVRVSTP